MRQQRHALLHRKHRYLYPRFHAQCRRRPSGCHHKRPNADHRHGCHRQHLRRSSHHRRRRQHNHFLRHRRWCRWRPQNRRRHAHTLQCGQYLHRGHQHQRRHTVDWRGSESGRCAWRRDRRKDRLQRRHSLLERGFLHFRQPRHRVERQRRTSEHSSWTGSLHRHHRRQRATHLEQQQRHRRPLVVRQHHQQLQRQYHPLRRGHHRDPSRLHGLGNDREPDCRRIRSRYGEPQWCRHALDNRRGQNHRQCDPRSTPTPPSSALPQRSP